MSSFLIFGAGWTFGGHSSVLTNIAFLEQPIVAVPVLIPESGMNETVAALVLAGHGIAIATPALFAILITNDMRIVRPIRQRDGRVFYRTGIRQSALRAVARTTHRSSQCRSCGSLYPLIV
jgi:DNA-binding transcriptional LysR family regulator